MGVVKGVAFVEVKITLNNEFLGNKNLEKSSYRFEKLPRWKKNTLGMEVVDAFTISLELDIEI